MQIESNVNVTLAASSITQQKPSLQYNSLHWFCGRSFAFELCIPALFGLRDSHRTSFGCFLPKTYNDFTTSKLVVLLGLASFNMTSCYDWSQNNRPKASAVAIAEAKQAVDAKLEGEDLPQNQWRLLYWSWSFCWGYRWSRQCNFTFDSICIDNSHSVRVATSLHQPCWTVLSSVYKVT